MAKMATYRGPWDKRGFSESDGIGTDVEFIRGVPQKVQDALARKLEDLKEFTFEDVDEDSEQAELEFGERDFDSLDEEDALRLQPVLAPSIVVPDRAEGLETEGATPQTGTAVETPSTTTGSGSTSTSSTAGSTSGSTAGSKSTSGSTGGSKGTSGSKGSGRASSTRSS